MTHCARSSFSDWARPLAPFLMSLTFHTDSVIRNMSARRIRPTCFRFQEKKG